jgi:Cof subfamily protein (haloacid dehalogenase superfamily)
MIKLIAFDIDGTALTSGNHYPDENRLALNKASEKGIVITIASGRLISFLPTEITSSTHLNYAITSNGASTVDLSDGSIIGSALLPNELAIKVQSAISKYNIFEDIYINGVAYTEKALYTAAINSIIFPEKKKRFLKKKYIFVDNLKSFISESKSNIEKINLPYVPEEIRFSLQNDLNHISGIISASSYPDNIEINSYLATKGYALESLISFLGIQKEECMAIGDGGNDIDMMSRAGISIAMGNATDDVKKAATYVTDDCDHLGFSNAIKKFALL